MVSRLGIKPKGLEKLARSRWIFSSPFTIYFYIAKVQKFYHGEHGGGTEAAEP